MAKSKLVHYNPGDAPGSPAYLTESMAKEQHAKDCTYLETMERVGFKVKNWPTIEYGVTKPKRK